MMPELDTFVHLGDCMHCGRPIEGRPARSTSSMTIQGLEPMEYRHMSDKSKECIITIRNMAVPYNQWNKRREWEEGGSHEPT
jgi:hypothetical protein